MKKAGGANRLARLLIEVMRLTSNSKPLKSRIPAGMTDRASSKQAPSLELGSPFIVGTGSRVTINERVVAETFAINNLVRFDSEQEIFLRYSKTRGIWVHVHEEELKRKLDDYLVQLGKQFGHQNVVDRVTSAKLGSLCRMIRMRGYQASSFKTDGCFHVANGILNLNDAKPELLPHDPRYPFTGSSGVKYDPKAKCPKFLNDLLGAALGKADIELLQKYCGSMLLGPNTCHGILIVRGTAGGGKSTFVTTVEKILGEQLVTELRTNQLTGRFETSAFVGKRLLVGKDVPGETLAVGGARMLKSLTGGDLLDAEFKFAPEKTPIRGDYHVIVVSNNNLRVALDGDRDAWQRRLLVVDFNRPKPGKPIPNFAEKLVHEEGSGILNWLIAGAIAYRQEMHKFGHLQLTDEQTSRVETLLADSDNVSEFVKESVSTQPGRDVSCEELVLAYYKRCDTNGWQPVSNQRFLTRLPDLLGHMFRTTRRNDIERDGKSVRGFKNIQLL